MGGAKTGMPLLGIKLNNAQARSLPTEYLMSASLLDIRQTSYRQN